MSSKKLGSTLEEGQELRSGTCLKADSIEAVATVTEDGNFVVCDEDPKKGNVVPLWQSRTRGDDAKLRIEKDGNLVLYDKAGNVLWASQTGGMGSAPFQLVMRDDRNLVLFGKGNPIWTSHTSPIEKVSTVKDTIESKKAHGAL